MNEKLKLMREGNINKALIVLGFPTIVGLLMTGFYNFVDSYFVAQLGTKAMGAISIVYPLVTLVPGIGLFFGNGGAAYISELLGSGEKENAEIVLSSTLFYCILTGILSQTVLLFLKPLLILMGASSIVLPMARQYGVILIISFLFHISSVCLMNLVRAEGAVWLSTFSQLAGSIINTILDPLLIFTFHMGIVGAAIATAISQFIAFAILIQYYLRKKSYLKLSFKNIRFNKWIISPIFKVGFPIFAINFFQSISLSATNVAAASYGDNTIAAIGIVNRVVGMTTFAITGFSRGYQTFISFNYGANNMDRVKKATKISYIWGISFGIVVSLCQVVFSRYIVCAFSADEKVISIGIHALFAGSILFFTYGFQAIAIVYLLCIKHNRAGFIFSVGRQGLFFLPVLFLASHFFNVRGILYAQSMADLITTLLLIVYIKRLSHTDGKVIKDMQVSS
ncbi:putative MATE family efflux protein [Clostridium tetanomorphum]|uniref:MATE family efflux transporter n=1 Tax=Clostridium tetanomorphum TaxID=1553 RepID=UPI000447B2CE|nr:MATE family efflux transporter [Clostridium tetanomorphum]KAJ52857.1 Na+ driven multidrug efflux pump [Clostridium tetanomorphum DSM 665]MBP1865446.1 putative MATE family efflux protein [Clostridium tetanomorphum]NRS84787.1 putative MATE family efflux protein [Clostridium tetanomorphum]SQB91708.1 Na+ driven multidrug efflux pump [Clostridium tetanomorphum]